MVQCQDAEPRKAAFALRGSCSPWMDNPDVLSGAARGPADQNRY